MKKISLLLLLFMSASYSLFAQASWSSDVANIIYTNCSKCHNTNGIGPFSLMSYFDAVDNAHDIQTAVNAGYMPPWPPDRAYSRLAHERVLTQTQVDAINNWINNGTPRGDSLAEPSAPVFSGTDEITNPDLTLTIPTYTVNTTTDLYRCFVLPSGLTAQKYLTGLETVPGNRSIVHHVLIFVDTTGVPAQLDANDPGPGYTAFGGTGSNNSKLIGVWVPGQTASFLPNGMGIRLPANGSIILQIHYPGGIISQLDSTKINIKYTSSYRRDVSIVPALNHYQLDQGLLRIPANTTRTFTAHYTVPTDLSLMAVGPHMHLIGRNIKSWGVTTSNDTIPFINIPNWDFHWQGIYYFPRILKIPTGTTLYSTAFYDNTTANPHNPNNPPVTVTLGEGTTDEMMLIYFQYTLYQGGDENIVIDSTIITSLPESVKDMVQTCQLYDPAPNPANDHLSVQYYLPGTAGYTLELYSIKGELVRILDQKQKSSTGFYTTDAVLNEAEGIYFLKLTSGGTVRTKRIIINR